MIQPSVRIDVVCAACSGRADVDPVYRHLSHWACPFCGRSNPMPAAASLPDPVLPSEEPAVTARRRIPWRSVVATLALAAAVVAGVAAQSRMPRGDYRTVEGLLAAMNERGVPCRAPVMDPAPAPGVRAAAACVTGDGTVWLMTFASPGRRDRYMQSWDPKRPAAVGSTWIAVTSSEATARAIARAFDVRFAGPGTASPE